mgnify:CR=1 FL=1|nr:hypothetical protein [uncultured Anaerosporobacter sp.]
MQLATKNEKFNQYAKTLASKNQSYINYWCSTQTVTYKKMINQNLINEKVEVTFDDKTIFEGIVEDIQIKSIYDTYNDPKIGGNNMLGLPNNYNLNDFIYEIRETLVSGYNFTSGDDIASIIIRVSNINVNKTRTLNGNQRGIKK